jgi:hypothetical protein
VPVAKKTLDEQIRHELLRLSRRDKRTVLDFARFLASQNGAEEEPIDLTASVKRALLDVKAGRGRPLKEVLDEL